MLGLEHVLLHTHFTELRLRVHPSMTPGKSLEPASEEDANPEDTCPPRLREHDNTITVSPHRWQPGHSLPHATSPALELGPKDRHLFSSSEPALPSHATRWMAGFDRGRGAPSLETRDPPQKPGTLPAWR